LDATPPGFIFTATSPTGGSFVLVALSVPETYRGEFSGSTTAVVVQAAPGTQVAGQNVDAPMFNVPVVADPDHQTEPLAVPDTRDLLRSLDFYKPTNDPGWAPPVSRWIGPVAPWLSDHVLAGLKASPFDGPQGETVWPIFQPDPPVAAGVTPEVALAALASRRTESLVEWNADQSAGDRIAGPVEVIPAGAPAAAQEKRFAADRAAPAQLEVLAVSDERDRGQAGRALLVALAACGLTGWVPATVAAWRRKPQGKNSWW
jgi:hypothetical protein